MAAGVKCEKGKSSGWQQPQAGGGDPEKDVAGELLRFECTVVRRSAMWSLHRCSALLCLFAALLFPSRAVADTIRITSGFVELVGAFDLEGDERGFQLVGSGYGGGSSPSAYAFCDGDDCNAEEVAQLQHAFGGLDLSVGSATLDGTTYNEVNTLGAEVFAEIGFSSTHLLPSLSGTAILNTPFTMQGSFSHPGGVETLVGSGIVNTRWISSAPGGSVPPAWNLAFARYEFSDAAAVPEPGTLLLVATGAAAAAAMSRRKRRA